MPEPTGCHVPELRGTDYPSQGYQAPVDNFSRSTGILIDQTRLPPPSPPPHQGYQMPEPSVSRAEAPAPCGWVRLRGVPNARTAAALAGTCPARGYQMPERYFPMALTWCAIFGTGGWEGSSIRPPSTGSILASG